MKKYITLKNCGVSIILIGIVLSVVALINTITTKAISVKCGISVTDGIYGNLSDASLPQGTNSFYSDEAPIFIFAVDRDLYIKKLDLYIYKNGSLYSHKSAPIGNYIRFWNMNDFSSLPAGSYTYKYTYSIAYDEYGNNLTTANSGEIPFNVYNSPYISQSPSSVTLKTGNTANFSVKAAGGKTSYYSYQWYYSTSASGNGYVISGANSSTYSLPASSSNSGRYYYCTVSDGERSATSSKAKLTTAYTVYYNSNGGSNTPSSQTKTHGTSLTLTSSKPTKSGYKFLGWSESSTATTPTYYSGSMYTSNANTTLYAVWTKDTNPTGQITSTNNLSSSQVVTLSFTDDTGIAGYFWGTNSDYQKNTYVSTSSTTVVKTVSNSGKYYLTVKDLAGNISNTISTTFVETSFDTNGGFMNIDSILTQVGQTIELPVPTRSGYSYQGWYSAPLNVSVGLQTNVKSKPPTDLVKSISPTSNKTYNAYWKATTAPYGQIYSTTNNTAVSQTTTLKLYAAKGVEGYYWSKDKTLDNNYFVKTSSSTVTVNVTEPGEYYLTVVDKDGNYSDQEWTTYFKTTFRLKNGEKVQPEYILSEAYSIVNLPFATKEGYVCKGWVMATSSMTSWEQMIGAQQETLTKMKADRNAEYVPVWEKSETIESTASKIEDITFATGSKPTEPTEKPTQATTVPTTEPTENPTQATTTPTIEPTEPQVIQQAQMITAKSYTKTYGSKAFSLNAKAKTKLSYKTSNKKVVTVSSKGKVTIKGCGKATITINAEATSEYQSAIKKITITVKPATVKIKRIVSKGKYINIKFNKQKGLYRYDVEISKDKKFNMKASKKLKGSVSSCKISGVIKGRKYYIRIRAKAKIGKKTVKTKWTNRTVTVR